MKVLSSESRGEVYFDYAESRKTFVPKGQQSDMRVPYDLKQKKYYHMKLGIMQPYFMPYIGYWQMIRVVDKYVVYDDVQFIKGGWINRNNIIVNGNVFMFNLILEGASSNKLINEISIYRNQTKLLKTIENSYRKAPYFESVYPIICKIFQYEDMNLAKFIGNSILEVCRYLNIDTEIIYSSGLDKNNELKGQDKVINICKLLNTDTYLNAIGGQALYNKDTFKSESIDLKFLKSTLSTYKQFKNDFIPALSIIDVMMFNSVDEVNVLLDNYTLV